MQIKLVVTDMDGTLLTDKKTISPRTLQLLHTLMDRDVKLMIATGRFLTSPKAYRDAYGLKALVAAANGTVIVGEDDNIINAKAIAPESVNRLVEVCKEYESWYYFVADEKIYAYDPQWDMAGFYQPRDGSKKLPEVTVEAFDRHIRPDEINDDIRKFQIFQPHRERYHLMKEVLVEDAGFEVSSSHENNMEITAKGLDKGRALRIVSEHLSIPLESILAFGDYDNDIPLLTTAGIGVAMENANTALKEVADEVTTSNNEDGIADVLERLLKEGRL